MLSGILLIDKPEGLTSHDVVLRARRALGVDRIGHSGTLDPMATGLLILLVGPATRLQGSFQSMPKSYSGAARLGLETETGDIEGKVVAERPVPDLEEEALRVRLRRWTGPLPLPAPRYSAVKHKGRPLYHYARRGIAVEPKARIQEVRCWELAAWRPPEFRFTMDCASGTYVRAVVEALGRDLGCGAALTALRRDWIGPYALAQARPLEAFLSEGAEQRARALIDAR